MSNPGPEWYWRSLYAVAAARTSWLVAVAAVCAKNNGIQGIRACFAMSTLQRTLLQTGSTPPDTELKARHQLFLESARTQRSDALMLGSLGLAAWGVLWGVDQGGGRLGSSLGILFVGVTLTIVGPTIFRVAGTEGTRMGLEIVLAVGHAAIVIALASFLPEVFHRTWLGILGFFVVIILVMRDVAEVRVELHQSMKLLTPGQPEIERRRNASTAPDAPP